MWRRRETGRTTLTTRRKAYNGKAIHAELEIESANIRKLVGKMRSNTRRASIGVERKIARSGSQDVLPGVLRSVSRNPAQSSARFERAAKTVRMHGVTRALSKMVN